jgi:O-antigen/teichoic acid export membrane protein
MGSLIPMVVALVAIPIMLEKLGLERFGLLTLAWLIVGYFSLFDFGLGRALTKIIAEYEGAGRREDVPQVFWTSMILMLSLGILGGILFWILAPVLARTLSVTVGYRSEAVEVFRLLATSLPIVIILAGLRGVLEAYHRFRLINLIKIPVGAATYILPVVILWFNDSLMAVVVGLICVRVLLLFIYGGVIWKTVPALQVVALGDTEVTRRLLAFGGWMTISNLVGPLMTYMDGFVIGVVLTVSAVAFYTVPYDVATKLWIFPTAIIVSLFPLLSQKLAGELDVAKRIFFGSVRFMFFALFPLVLVLVSFSKELLVFWLGSEFGNESTLVLQILLIGVFVNSMAMFPYALLQSAGYPRYTAFLHLLELPLYGVLLIFLLNELGIVGAAVAWLVRVIFDNALLGWIVCKCLPEFASVMKTALVGQLLAMLLFLMALLMPSLLSRVILSASVIILTSVWGTMLLVNLCRAHGIDNLSSIRKLLNES